MDADHFLVAAKVRNNTCKSVQRRFDVQKLRSQKIAETFSIRLSELLHDTQLQHIAHSLHTAAGEKIGYRRQQKSTWFDDECRQAAIEKNSSCFTERSKNL